MRLTISNIPKNMGYEEIKLLIQGKCGHMQYKICNLESYNKGSRMVVEISDECDAAILMRQLNGIYINGIQLFVELANSDSSQQNYAHRQNIQSHNLVSYPQQYSSIANIEASRMDPLDNNYNKSMSHQAVKPENHFGSIRPAKAVFDQRSRKNDDQRNRKNDDQRSRKQDDRRSRNNDDHRGHKNDDRRGGSSQNNRNSRKRNRSPIRRFDRREDSSSRRRASRSRHSPIIEPSNKKIFNPNQPFYQSGQHNSDNQTLSSYDFKNTLSNMSSHNNSATNIPTYNNAATNNMSFNNPPSNSSPYNNSAMNMAPYNNAMTHISQFNVSEKNMSQYSNFATNLSSYNNPATNLSPYNNPPTNESTYNNSATNLSLYNNSAINIPGTYKDSATNMLSYNNPAINMSSYNNTAMNMPSFNNPATIPIQSAPIMLTPYGNFSSNTFQQSSDNIQNRPSNNSFVDPSSNMQQSNLGPFFGQGQRNHTDSVWQMNPNTGSGQNLHRPNPGTFNPKNNSNRSIGQNKRPSQNNKILVEASNPPNQKSFASKFQGGLPQKAKKIVQKGPLIKNPPQESMTKILKRDKFLKGLAAKMILDKVKTVCEETETLLGLSAIRHKADFVIRSRLERIVGDNYGLCTESLVNEYRRSHPVDTDNNLIPIVLSKLQLKKRDLLEKIAENKAKPEGAKDSGTQCIAKKGAAGNTPAGLIPKYINDDKNDYKALKTKRIEEEITKGEIYQLPEVDEEALTKETKAITDIVNKTWSEEPVDIIKMQYEDNNITIKDEMEKYIKLFIKKRILNITTNLCVRIYCYPKQPKRERFEEFLKEYGVVCGKNSYRGNVYVATCDSHKNYDRILELQSVELDGITLSIKPFQLAGRKPKYDKSQGGLNQNPVTKKAKLEKSPPVDDSTPAVVQDDAVDKAFDSFIQELNPNKKVSQQEKPLLEEKPVQSNKGKPVQSNKGKPVQSNQGKPVQSNQGKPVQPNQSKPVQSNESKPVQPNQSKPVQSNQSKPVQSNQSKPVQPNQSKPVQSNEGKPEQPKQDKLEQDDGSEDIDIDEDDLEDY